MPLSLTTLSLVDSPVTLQEGVKILERDDYRCQYCGLDGRASFENALVMRVDFVVPRSEEHTSELQSPDHLVCRLLLEKKKKTNRIFVITICNRSDVYCI